MARSSSSSYSSSSLPSAKLHKDGRPSNSCCFGAGIMSREEAFALIESGMAAPLIITNTRGESGHYWLSLLLHKGEVTGYRIIEDTPEGVVYDLDTEFGCDCPGATKHGTACKHAKSVRALKATGRIK